MADAPPPPYELSGEKVLRTHSPVLRVGERYVVQPWHMKPGTILGIKADCHVQLNVDGRVTEYDPPVDVSRLMAVPTEWIHAVLTISEGKRVVSFVARAIDFHGTEPLPVAPPVPAAAAGATRFWCNTHNVGKVEVGPFRAMVRHVASGALRAPAKSEDWTLCKEERQLKQTNDVVRFFVSGRKALVFAAQVSSGPYGPLMIVDNDVAAEFEWIERNCGCETLWPMVKTSPKHKRKGVVVNPGNESFVHGAEVWLACALSYARKRPTSVGGGFMLRATVIAQCPQ